MIAHPITEPEIDFVLSVRVMNDTVSPKGLVSSALVFGEFPTVRNPFKFVTKRPPFENRLKVVEVA